jgi:hypothetical protein
MATLIALASYGPKLSTPILAVAQLRHHGIGIVRIMSKQKKNRYVQQRVELGSNSAILVIMALGTIFVSRDISCLMKPCNSYDYIRSNTLSDKKLFGTLTDCTRRYLHAILSYSPRSFKNLPLTMQKGRIQ